ncbi:MAG: lipid A-modifier LpxR family protein [Bacteroidota bacterium]
MRRTLCCLFIFICSSNIICQEQPGGRIYKNAIELRHDNDFLLFTDRYYTTGSFIGWHTLLNTPNKGLDRWQYSLFIQQELYTPADLLETEIRRFDRPYAGFLGLTNGLQLTNHRRILDFKVTLGITGPFSGGAGIQEVFHSTASNDARIPVWLGQINTSAFGNLYATYIREWQWQPNPFSVHFAASPSATIGNRDIYAQPEVAFFFGRRDPIGTTSAYNQLGSIKNEYFFAIRMAYRYVFHNALLEGNLIGDSSSFLIDPYKNMFLYSFEANARLKRFNLLIAYNFATPQTRKTDPHLFMTFGVTRAF